MKAKVVASADHWPAGWTSKVGLATVLADHAQPWFTEFSRKHGERAGG